MATVDDGCPVCHSNGARSARQPEMERDTIHYNCPLCGNYRCVMEAATFSNLLPALSPSDRTRLSGVLREQSERAPTGQFTEWPLIWTDNIDSLLAAAPSPFDVPAKIRKLLATIARKSTRPGEWVQFVDDTCSPTAYAADYEEWAFFVAYAERQEWLEHDVPATLVGLKLRLTPAGWEETQRRPRLESDKAFAAMWFDPSVRDAFLSGIKPAIEDDCHYRCARIDAQEFNGDVVDQIMAEIRESRFVVCDLTGHRNGVYFEAGFAMGLGIPVIWTCRDDAAQGTHFDTEHFNQIRWSMPAELRKKLATRIRATIGIGPLA